MALSLLGAFQGAFQGPAPIQGRVTATSRASVPLALDVVVAPDAKAPKTEDEVPGYMKSKRNLYPRKCDVMDQIEYFVQEQIDGGLLLDAEKAWQPTDFLPDSQKPTEEWFDEVREMRKVADELPDELLLVLIGDMITEEALPTYLTLLNTLEGTDDPTGAVDTAWGRWSRQWTSEENRHGDLLNRYLYITGRVDMRSIEQTIMRLISSGFDPDTRSDPYRGFIYTSFQARRHPPSPPRFRRPGPQPQPSTPPPTLHPDCPPLPSTPTPTPTPAPTPTPTLALTRSAPPRSLMATWAS